MCNPDTKNVTKYLAFDMREGGEYVLEVRLPNGHRYLNKGTYQLIRWPEKLVFSWAGERLDPGGNKLSELNGRLVTVDFLEQGRRRLS